MIESKKLLKTQRGDYAKKLNAIFIKKIRNRTDFV
jgi:hypothetical protein